jgi:chromosome segregation ATPase
MSTLEERVAYLEGRLEDHATSVSTLHHRVDELHADMRRGFEQVDKRFELVDKRFEQVDKRFEQIDKRFEQVDKRFEQVDTRFEQIDRRFEQVDGRLIGLDQKIDRHFTWLVGIQVAVLVSVVGALAGAYFR